VKIFYKNELPWKVKKYFVFVKIFRRSLKGNTVLSQCGGRFNGGGEGIAKAPRSVGRTRFYEYFMEKLGAEMAHYPKKIFRLKDAIHSFTRYCRNLYCRQT
jgi:hypothetical protein